MSLLCRWFEFSGRAAFTLREYGAGDDERALKCGDVCGEKGMGKEVGEPFSPGFSSHHP